MVVLLVWPNVTWSQGRPSVPWAQFRIPSTRTGYPQHRPNVTEKSQIGPLRSNAYDRLGRGRGRGRGRRRRRRRRRRRWPGGDWVVPESRVNSLSKEGGRPAIRAEQSGDADQRGRGRTQKTLMSQYLLNDYASLTMSNKDYRAIDISLKGQR